MRLENRTAIVTGGANGIGRAVARIFAREGARVTIWDKAEDAGRELASEIDGARFQAVDVADPASVECAVEELVQAWRRIDILVNNAGILRDAQLASYKDGELRGRMSVEDYDTVLEVNLRGVFLCTRAVTPVMIRQGYGRILSASSVVGLYGNFGQTNYVAAKAGVIGMTRVWARELGRYNITANAVAPGFIATEILRSMPEKVLEMMVSRVPSRRIGQPEDIANAFLFLASDEASYINGAVLSVDGGLVTGT
jgi:3-oxoacyl-[acyl-carrier protein] reductase